MLIRAINILGAKSKDGTGPIYPGCVADVDDAIGIKFVRLGHAVEVPAPAAVLNGDQPVAPDPDGENTPEGENATEAVKTAIPVDEENNTMDRTYLETLSLAELKEIAQAQGVYSGNLRSKTAIIDALTAVEVSDEELPTFEPLDVVDE